MIMTNEQMLDNVSALHGAKDEKGLLGYAIAVNLRRLRTEVGEYSKTRDELLEKYGTPDGAGRFNLTREAAEAFREELRPYADVETEVQVMQVPPEVFYSGNLTSAQMYALAWMVKEE